MPSSPRSSFVSSLVWLGKTFTDLVFPPTCVACKRPGSVLCDHCAQRVEPISQSICLRCGKIQTSSEQTLCHSCKFDPNPVLSLTRAAAHYAEPLRTMIHHFKYEKQPELAEPLVRYLLAAFAKEEWHQGSGINLVVPVPMFSERQKQRGYNQAELLARCFSNATHLPFASQALKRIRFTQPQVGLSERERQRNVKDAFVAHPNVKGRSVLIIDDVYTTGATLRSCATSLIEAGSAQVYALALAIPIARQ